MHQVMTKITYLIGSETGTISWVAAEQFAELTGKTFRLDSLAAVDIEKMTNLSLTAKILLSAVAGAVIQHLLDKEIEPSQIFAQGTLTIHYENPPHRR